MAKSKSEKIKPVVDNDEALAADDNNKVADNVTGLPVSDSAPAATAEELDEEEKEFKALRRDLPGVKGASAAGIVAISVGKAPPKNEFFRTHRDFRPIVSIIDHDVGLEKQFFAVTKDMVEPLMSIGVSVADYALYLVVTSRGAYRVVPVRQASGDNEQNEYHRTKELGLVEAENAWRRLYTDQENKCYKVYPAPEGRFSEPQWPQLREARIFKLAFRDKGISHRS